MRVVVGISLAWASPPTCCDPPGNSPWQAAPALEPGEPPGGLCLQPPGLCYGHDPRDQQLWGPSGQSLGLGYRSGQQQARGFLLRAPQEAGGVLQHTRAGWLGTS